MTESTDNKQEPCPVVAAEKEPELTKAIAEEALKKVEELTQENAQLRERLKLIEKIYKKYDHLDGYMEKYGANSHMERDMWQAIRQVVKG
jgi:DNA repair exonuclease SbcCD ATPase subunit